MVAVRQKVQPIAQPTWLETHSVRRDASGMKTASRNFSSAVFRRYFIVPSLDSWARSISSGARVALSPSPSRKGFESSVSSSSR